MEKDNDDGDDGNNGGDDDDDDGDDSDDCSTGRPTVVRNCSQISRVFGVCSNYLCSDGTVTTFLSRLA